MIGRAALALATLILTAAVAAPWAWQLPAGVTAPVVPADNPMSAAKVALGRRLFYDADLSIDGTMSCASCHEKKHAFADGNTTRPGVHGDAGRRNVPASARTLREAVARHPVTLDGTATDHVLAYLEALTDRGFIENPAFAYPDRPCGKD